MEILKELTLSNYEKMRNFETYLGTGKGRRENIKACKDSKLLDFYKECIRCSYFRATQAIKSELIARGLRDVAENIENNFIASSQNSTTTNTTSFNPTRDDLNTKSLIDYIGGISENDLDFKD